MVEKKVYELEDGTELFLMERIKINNIIYLLLSGRKDDKVYIGYEEIGKINFIDENYKNYDKIISILFSKFKKNLNNSNM